MSLPNPITRKEQYLAKAAGESVSIPEEPQTREEMYLEKIAEGGGGTTVIANPSGEATDDLTKIQIGNTIYDIEGGGGSGAGYTKELVYDSGSWSTYAPYNTDVSFTKSIAEFDQLLFIVASPGDDPASNKINRSALIIDIDSVSEWGYSTFYMTRTLRLVDITNTTFNYYSDVNPSYDRDRQLGIYKIYGIKFGGGGGDASLESDVTANTTVGAISSGTKLNEGTTFTEFVQKLLISELAPNTTFTASGSGTKETGSSVTPTLTLNITSKGTGTPTAIKFYSGSTLLDTQAYVDGTNTYTYTMETAITTTTTVKGVLEYTKSDGTTATVEKTATYTFVMASYYGAVTTAPTDKAGITALTKVVKTTKGQTATFNLSNQRSCYCYPASMGNLTSIKDANNFEYISSYTKTTVAVDGVDYNVYTLTDPVTATGFKQVYA